jgi:hypothetical protein
VAVVALAVLLPAPSSAQTKAATAMDDSWHFSVAPYFWFSGLNGTVSVKGVVEVPVDESFSDIMKNFDLGFLGHFEGRKKTVGFATDIMWLNLGAKVPTDRPILGALNPEADARTLITEGLVFYRAESTDRGAYFDLLGGLRYIGTSAQLKGQANGLDLASTKKTLDWVDGLVGFRFRVPLGTRAGLAGRTDVGAIGSKITWNLLGSVDFSLGEHWATAAGYRYLNVDYDKGEGSDRHLWDVTYKGPYAWVGYSW